MKKNVVIGIVVLVIILVVGVFVAQKKTEVPVVTPVATSSVIDMTPVVPQAKVSTEGWKTCRNEEYGYEFQYPSYLVLYPQYFFEDIDLYPYSKGPSVDCSGENNVIFFAPRVLNEAKSEDRDAQLLEFIFSKHNKSHVTTSIENIYPKISHPEDGTQPVMTLEKVYFIAGTKAYFSHRINAGQEENEGSLFLAHPEHGWVLEIRDIYGHYVTYPTLDPTLETILSTFKFIQKTPAQ